MVTLAKYNKQPSSFSSPQRHSKAGETLPDEKMTKKKIFPNSMIDLGQNWRNKVFFVSSDNKESIAQLIEEVRPPIYRLSTNELNAIIVSRVFKNTRLDSFSTSSKDNISFHLVTDKTFLDDVASVNGGSQIEDEVLIKNQQKIREQKNEGSSEAKPKRERQIKYEFNTNQTSYSHHENESNNENTSQVLNSAIRANPIILNDDYETLLSNLVVDPSKDIQQIDPAISSPITEPVCESQKGQAQHNIILYHNPEESILNADNEQNKYFDKDLDNNLYDQSDINITSILIDVIQNPSHAEIEQKEVKSKGVEEDQNLLPDSTDFILEECTDSYFDIMPCGKDCPEEIELLLEEIKQNYDNRPVKSKEEIEISVEGPNIIWISTEENSIPNIIIEFIDLNYSFFYNCNSNLLSDHSAYFKWLFSSDTKGISDNISNIITVRLQMTNTVFHILIEFISTGIMNVIIDEKNIIPLYKGSLILQIDRFDEIVIAPYINKLIKERRIDDFIDLLLKEKLITIPDTLANFIASNFQDFVNLPQIKELPFAAIYNIISNPHIVLRDEGTLLQFIVEYIHMHKNKITLKMSFALGNFLKWNYVSPDIIKELEDKYETNYILQLITQLSLQEYINEFEERISIFPEDYIFALLLTEPDIFSVFKFANRYSYERNLFFITPIEYERCDKLHIEIGDFPLDGHFKRCNFTFRLSFKDGAYGAFFNIRFKLTNMEGCKTIHIKYKPYKAEKIIHEKIDIDKQTEFKDFVLVNHKIFPYLVNEIRISITGIKKPHGDIQNTLLTGCVIEV